MCYSQKIEDTPVHVRRFYQQLQDSLPGHIRIVKARANSDEIECTFAGIRSASGKRVTASFGTIPLNGLPYDTPYDDESAWTPLEVRVESLDLELNVRGLKTVQDVLDVLATRAVIVDESK